MSDTSSPIVPEPGSADAETGTVPAPAHVGDTSREPRPTDPTRYGDWEKNGRCIDF